MPIELTRVEGLIEVERLSFPTRLTHRVMGDVNFYILHFTFRVLHFAVLNRGIGLKKEYGAISILVE